MFRIVSHHPFVEDMKMDETVETVKPSRQRVESEAPKIVAKQQEEDKSYKVVITITETYQDKDQAVSAYGRFANGHGHHVVLKQGGKVLEEKDWGSVTDKRGYHSIGGSSQTIFLDEHL